MKTVLWLGGWASDFKMLEKSLRQLAPDAAWMAIDPHAVAASPEALDAALEDLQARPGSKLVLAWSLGTLQMQRWLLQQGENAPFPIVLVNPIANLVGKNAPWSERVMLRMRKRLRENAEAVLTEFWQLTHPWTLGQDPITETDPVSRVIPREEAATSRRAPSRAEVHGFAAGQGPQAGRQSREAGPQGVLALPEPAPPMTFEIWLQAALQLSVDDLDAGLADLQRGLDGLKARAASEALRATEASRASGEKVWLVGDPLDPVFPFIEKDWRDIWPLAQMRNSVAGHFFFEQSLSAVAKAVEEAWLSLEMRV